VWCSVLQCVTARSRAYYSRATRRKVSRKSVSICVAVRCSVLQRVDEPSLLLKSHETQGFHAHESVSVSQCVAVCCSALTSLLLKSRKTRGCPRTSFSICVAVRCSALQCVDEPTTHETRGSDRTSVTIYRAHLRKVQSSRRCGAVCCSALQRVAVTIQQDLRSRADEPNMTSHIFKKNLAFEPNNVWFESQGLFEYMASNIWRVNPASSISFCIGTFVNIWLVNWCCFKYLARKPCCIGLFCIRVFLKRDLRNRVIFNCWLVSPLP